MSRRIIAYLLALLLALSVLAGCESLLSGKSPALDSSSQTAEDSGKEPCPEEKENQLAEKGQPEKPTGPEKLPEDEPAPAIPSAPAPQAETPAEEAPSAPDPEPEPVGEFSSANIPAFSGAPYVAVNGNQPFFEESEITEQSFETYAPLDGLGRCGTAFACVGRDLMPTVERGPIGMVKPSGWHTVKYDCVNGKYLYNRCHLIGYQLSGENANTSNLITGTRYLNTEGMLPFENMVADYVKETGSHVMYRVTPIFEGGNLLAAGVLMEGYSVEDQGEGIEYCVYVYNAQPGVEIDYATGDSRLGDDVPAADINPEPEKPQPVPAPVPEPEEPQTSPEPAPEEPQDSQEPANEEPVEQCDFIININTKKFHLPSCPSVDRMKESNKREYIGTKEELIAQGYSPCKNCLG